MGPHFASFRVPRGLGWLVAAAAIVAAAAAISLPESAGGTGEIASVLAVGALAMVAGHAWGLAVVSLADVFLLAKLAAGLWSGSLTPELWPVFVAIGGAIPGLLLLRPTLPRTIELLVGTRAFGPVGRNLGTALVAAAIVLPIL